MSDNYSKDRRNFLRSLALFGGTAVAASLAGKSRAAVKKPLLLPEKTVESKGYRETEHILKYYKSAAI